MGKDRAPEVILGDEGSVTRYAFLPGRTFSNSYSYDAASNRTGYTDPEQSTVSYSYDDLNRLTGLNSSLAGNFGFGYDELSRRTSLTRPNGVVTSYGYDNLSRLLSVLHKQNGTTTIDGAGYVYDNAGNRTAKGNMLTGTMEEYAYDAIYQLTQLKRDGTVTESYTYDKVGNRLTSLDVASYSYNSSNQLTAADATSFTYDQNGNTTSKTDTNGQTTYAWDYENRLTSVTLSNGGGVVTFKYDPFGRRVQKSSASGTTVYVYDGANGVEEVNASGAVTARYLQGAGIDEPLAQSSPALNFYSADGLGSITSLTDAAGAPAATYVYGAFGVLNSSAGTVPNSYRYTAREYDQETGLYYYRARYYDSRIGRFISEDPIGFEGGVNFHAYVLNNPIGLVDPGGLKVYPANFIGPLQPGDVRGFIAELSDPALSALANYPFPSASRFYGESDQCVSFTKHFAKLPCTDCWRAGPPVIGSDIPRGTAIATFDENGRYPQDASGHPNSGIYLQPGVDPNSFFIIDQWPNHHAKVRNLGPKPRARADNATAYSVITVPYGTKSRMCKCGNW